jgi:pyrroline-5-carboxylate reductase
MKLGFLGTGTITSAMVTGLSAGDRGEYAILLSPRNAEIAADLAQRFANVTVAASNQQVIDRCDTVVIAVRPQVAEGVLSELRFREGQHAISVVSGFSVQRLARLVAPATRVIRAVPLPSAAKRRSPTAIYPPDQETTALFALLGAAFEVNTETAFDALCSTTATMATYFAFADAAAAWLTRHNIPPQQARDYIAQIFAGLSATALESPQQTFEALITDHATRGGTNEQLLAHMRERGAFDIFSEALDGIMRRVTAASR